MGAGVSIGCRVVSSLSLNTSEHSTSKNNSRSWRIISNIFSAISASEMVLLALKATRYAVKSASFIEGIFAAAIALPILVALGDRYKIDIHLTMILNVISLVAAVAAVALGALPLMGMGGLAIALNGTLLLHDHLKEF